MIMQFSFRNFLQNIFKQPHPSNKDRHYDLNIFSCETFCFSWCLSSLYVVWLVLLTIPVPVYPSKTSTMSSSVPAYPLSSTPAASSVGSGGGKMKRERTTARPSSKRPEEDEVRA